MQSSILFEQVPHQHQQHTVGFTKAQEATVAGFFEAAAASNNNNLLMTLTIPSSVITSAAAAAAAADMELDDNNVPAPASPSASTISDCSSTSTPTRSKKNVSFVPYVDVYHTFHPEDYDRTCISVDPLTIDDILTVISMRKDFASVTAELEMSREQMQEEQ